MTDPERISKRHGGLAAELVRAGAAEAPPARGLERTLAALGVSSALVTAGATASATAATAVSTKTVTGLVLAKWIGAGVLGGVALSGTAALVTSPAAPPPSIVATAKPAIALSAAALAPTSEAPSAPRMPEAAASSAEVDIPPLRSPAAVMAAPALEALEVGVPLAAEVAAVDRARALLASGQAERGLAELVRYEREFPDARLLPEVLFLRLETYVRLGRDAEARSAASRLLRGFPQSPHAARARKVLGL